MIDIVCLGELLIDMFPAEIGRPLAEVSAFRPVPGGAPANVAIAAARQGTSSAFIGKVGDDPFGHFLAQTLAQQGVETRGMRFDKEARAMIRAVLPRVHVLKVNKDELQLLTGSTELEEGSKELLASGLDLCVVTLGPDGSFFQCAAGSGFVPGFQVHALDATGSGDAFIATLLIQLVAGDETWRAQLTPPRLQAILRRANAAGALTTLKQGALSALPDAESLDEFLRTASNQ